MPMLEEEEFASVARLYSDAIRATKEFRQEYGLPLEGHGIDDRFRPVIDAYERLTGWRVTNAKAIMHHRLSMYGPPCKTCGKPLRTPDASKCFSCGAAK
jgi:hypothetical protein